MTRVTDVGDDGTFLIFSNLQKTDKKKYKSKSPQNKPLLNRTRPKCSMKKCLYG